MGMAVGTGKAQDAEAVADGDTADEVDQGTAVAGMNPAGTLCPAAGAGLSSGRNPSMKESNRATKWQKTPIIRLDAKWTSIEEAEKNR